MSALRKLTAFAILFLRLPNALSAVLAAIEQPRTMSEATSLIVSAKPMRREHVPLGILYMVGATIVFAASSAVSVAVTSTSRACVSISSARSVAPDALVK